VVLVDIVSSDPGTALCRYVAIFSQRIGEGVPDDDVLTLREAMEAAIPPAGWAAMAVIRMKLTSFRLQDQVHLIDLLEVGLIDASWCDRLPAELSARLRQLIDTRQRETQRQLLRPENA